MKRGQFYGERNKTKKQELKVKYNRTPKETPFVNKIPYNEKRGLSKVINH